MSKERCGKILFIYIVNLLSSKSELNKVTNTNNLQLSQERKEEKEYFNVNLSNCYLSL